MEVSNENDLRGPGLSLVDHVEGSPAFWVRGAKIRSKVDGQKARAAYAMDLSPIACLERGVAGVFKLQTRFSDWELDEEEVELTPMDRARISYSADQALLTSLGTPGVPAWSGLIEQRRIGWMSACEERTPFDGEHGNLRTRLRDSIMKALLFKAVSGG